MGEGLGTGRKANSRCDQDLMVWSCIQQVPGSERHRICLENKDERLFRRTQDP